MAMPNDAPWRPSLGACVRPDGVSFRVWAPRAQALEVVLERGGRPLTARALERGRDGCFEALVPEAAAGDEYRYRVDGKGPFPDPASRFQPAGVHGPSLVVDPAAFRWTDADWKGVPFGELTFYELHLGTFTLEGTFDGAAARLDALAELGVTALELMPVADFPGRRNWGYDGAALFAPARCYGAPDRFRAFVDAAHRRGLAVFLDVVYNHLGPDGNYTGAFSPVYFTAKHRGPWGEGVNLDGEGSRQVRDFFVENAMHWIHEYHLDGLRLDATHALVDESPRHFLAELGERVRASLPEDRPVALIAEDERNLARLVKPCSEGGWGLDAVWADDFHHQMRHQLVGDHDGYYADFEDRLEDLALILRQGWLYTGQRSAHLKGPRGTPPGGLEPGRFVFCLQNHDQVGNRALGERLNSQIDAAVFRAATVLLLTAPQTPLLFMGQEWGAATPFLYFTDHEPELGKRITEGRRREFAAFSSFKDPKARVRIPDPQALETFELSRLNWEERRGDGAQGLLRLHQALLTLRRAEFSRSGAGSTRVMTLPNDNGVAMERIGAIRTYLVLVQLRASGRIEIGALDLPRPEARWHAFLSTEDARYCVDPEPIACRLDGPRPDVEFGRPGAVILVKTS
ncbi:MAG: malto-oligosyltrehalose trehalohydrolase [Elusimicrobia bacterium]|nr:malto-oligosyltrehalose trehalohydrolase [Elusimicrobiota bacterium]